MRTARRWRRGPGSGVPSWTALVLLGALLACSAEPGMQGLPVLADPIDAEAERTPLRYRETGLVSANDRCPVRHDRLSPHVPPVYVNGRPIGFC